MSVQIWKNGTLLSSTHWDSGNGKVLQAMLNGTFCSENSQTYSKPLAGDVFELEGGKSIYANDGYGIGLYPHGAAGKVYVRTRNTDNIIGRTQFITADSSNRIKNDLCMLWSDRPAPIVRHSWLKEDGTQNTQKHAHWCWSGLHMKQDYSGGHNYPWLDFGPQEDGYLGDKINRNLLPDGCEVERMVFSQGANFHKIGGAVIWAPHGNGFSLHHSAFLGIRQNISVGYPGDYYCITTPYNLNNDGSSWMEVNDNYMDCGGELNFFGFAGESLVGMGSDTQFKRLRFKRNWCTRPANEWWSQYIYNAATKTFADTADPAQFPTGHPNWPIPSTYIRIKNLMEFKSAKDVEVEGNLFENCWRTSDQIGGFFLPSLRDESGNPWAQMLNIRCNNNVVKNAQMLIGALAYDEGWHYTTCTNGHANWLKFPWDGNCSVCAITLSTGTPSPPYHPDRTPPYHMTGTGRGPGRGLQVLNNLFLAVGIKAWPPNNYMVLLSRGYMDFEFMHNTVMCQNNVPYGIGFEISYDQWIDAVSWPGKGKATAKINSNAFPLATPDEYVYGQGRVNLFAADDNGYSPVNGWAPGISRLASLEFLRNVIGGGGHHPNIGLYGDWPGGVSSENYTTANHAAYKALFRDYDGAGGLIDPRWVKGSPYLTAGHDGRPIGVDLNQLMAAMGPNLYSQAGVVLP